MTRVPQKSPMIDPVWNLAFPARALCFIPVTQLSFFFFFFCSLLSLSAFHIFGSEVSKEEALLSPQPALLG